MPSPQNNLTSDQKPHRHLGTLVVLVIWLVGLSYLAVHRQQIYDWWRLRDYDAPVVVAQLAAQDAMTDYGQKIFYVNHPDITSKADFSSQCPNNGGEQTIVLGCYHSDQAGIFLLDVSDPRLDGVEQVTAAHEMLHGAYDRLSPAEKSNVDKMLQDYYDNGLKDQRIISTINAYKKSEPNDVVNEMHSIFGTEVANLPATLEDYYRRYFNDRSKVVAYANQYQSVFTSRQSQISAYDRQLNGLKQQIDDIESDLKVKQATINTQEQALVNQRDSGNIAQYNAGVASFNSLVDNYNSEVVQLKLLITQYNQTVTTRNAIAFEQDQLVKELTSSAAPINK